MLNARREGAGMRGEEKGGKKMKTIMPCVEAASGYMGREKRTTADPLLPDMCKPLSGGRGRGRGGGGKKKNYKR